MHYEKIFANSNVQLNAYKIVLILSLVLLNSSCSTTKNATTLTNNTQQTERITSTITTLDIGEVERTVLTTTHWSVPDSTGKQYPTKTTEQTTERAKAEQKTTATLSNEQHAQSEESQTKTSAKTKTPNPLNWVAIIGTIGALIIVYLTLKRYKIL